MYCLVQPCISVHDNSFWMLVYFISCLSHLKQVYSWFKCCFKCNSHFFSVVFYKLWLNSELIHRKQIICRLIIQKYTKMWNLVVWIHLTLYKDNMTQRIIYIMALSTSVDVWWPFQHKIVAMHHPFLANWHCCFLFVFI